MSRDDRTYFQRRAETELELAQKAQHPDVVQAHYELASFYLDRVHDPESQQNETDRCQERRDVR